MQEFELTGLDGGNLLGYLAALGTLRILTLAEPEAEVQMLWAAKAWWTPVVIHSRARTDVELVDTLTEALADANAAYRQDFLDLPLEDFRNEIETAAQEPSRRTSDFFTALGSDCFPETRGGKQPSTTQFRAIGAGNNDGFLGIMRIIHSNTNRQHLSEALFSEWDYTDPNPFMRWDPNEYRPHALRARDPADDKKRTNVRGANRLAIEALPLFPTVPTARKVRTTGFDENDQVIWPIWLEPLNLSCASSLVALGEIQEADRSAMKRRGIAQVFRAQRFTDFRYRNFRPAKALL